MDLQRLLFSTRTETVGVSFSIQKWVWNEASQSLMIEIVIVSLIRPREETTVGQRSVNHTTWWPILILEKFGTKMLGFLCLLIGRSSYRNCFTKKLVSMEPHITQDSNISKRQHKHLKVVWNWDLTNKPFDKEKCILYRKMMCII